MFRAFVRAICSDKGRTLETLGFEFVHGANLPSTQLLNQSLRVSLPHDAIPQFLYKVTPLFIWAHQWSFIIIDGHLMHTAWTLVHKLAEDPSHSAPPPHYFTTSPLPLPTSIWGSNVVFCILLQDYLKADSAFARSTVVTAVKFTISDQVRKWTLLSIINLYNLLLGLSCRNLFLETIGIFFVIQLLRICDNRKLKSFMTGFRKGWLQLAI